MADVLTSALRYVRSGWSIVPCGQDKRPLVAWSRWQSERPDAPQVRDWWSRWPEANVAVITGAISGVVVLDLDHGHTDGVDGLESVRRSGRLLPETPCVRTPSGGMHCYFRHPGSPVANAAGILPGVDFRGDGGYVLAPPSTTPAGAYEPLAQTRGLKMAAAPDWVLQRESSSRDATAAGEWAQLWGEQCARGGRNATAAKLAGHLAAHGLGEDEAQVLVAMWAAGRCDPPLDSSEVERTVTSVYRTDGRRHPERTATSARRDAFWWRGGEVKRA